MFLNTDYEPWSLIAAMKIFELLRRRAMSQQNLVKQRKPHEDLSVKLLDETLNFVPH